MCRLALLYISLVPFGQRLINCCTVMTMSSWESLWLGLAITCSNNTYTTLPPRPYPTLYLTLGSQRAINSNTHLHQFQLHQDQFHCIHFRHALIVKCSHRRAQDWRQTRRNQLVPQSALWLSSIVLGKEHTIYREKHKDSTGYIYNTG